MVDSLLHARIRGGEEVQIRRKTLTAVYATIKTMVEFSYKRVYKSLLTTFVL